MTKQEQKDLFGFEPLTNPTLSKCHNLALRDLNDADRLMWCRSIFEGITGLEWRPDDGAEDIAMSREWICLAILEAFEAGRGQGVLEGR